MPSNQVWPFNLNSDFQGNLIKNVSQSHKTSATTISMESFGIIRKNQDTLFIPQRKYFSKGNSRTGSTWALLRLFPPPLVDLHPYYIPVPSSWFWRTGSLQPHSQIFYIRSIAFLFAGYLFKLSSFLFAVLNKRTAISFLTCSLLLHSPIWKHL